MRISIYFCDRKVKQNRYAIMKKVFLLFLLFLFNNKIFFNCSIDSEGLTKYLETFLGMR